MLRKLIVLLCILMVFTVGLPVQVQAGEVTRHNGYIPIDPLWTHTMLIVTNLVINNGRATMTGSVIGHGCTERISASAVLVRVNDNGTTSHIGSWSNIEVVGGFLNWERAHYVAVGHYYRLTVTATVFRNGESEIVSASSSTRAK